MSKFLDGTGLSDLITKIKNAFVAKADTTAVTGVGVDSTPTANSTNLVESGGVFSALGKWGVVSQTQTWTGDANTGYDHTNTDIVWGIIPSDSIGKAKLLGANFNESTGYFEMNGLLDLCLEDIEFIALFNPLFVAFDSTITLRNRDVPRTFKPISFKYAAIGYSTKLYSSVGLEIFAITQNEFISALTMQNLFAYNARLKRVIGGYFKVDGFTAANGFNSTFTGCYSLESVHLLGIKYHVPFANSPRLELESIVFAVQNAANTTAITITLHATAYARCQADTTEYTYNGATYTGILAYASARNITLASAN